MNEPQMIERECGGWLAIAPKDCRFRIGVTGATAEIAREVFFVSLARWEAILAEDDGAQP